MRAVARCGKIFFSLVVAECVRGGKNFILFVVGPCGCVWWHARVVHCRLHAFGKLQKPTKESLIFFGVFLVYFWCLLVEKVVEKRKTMNVIVRLSVLLRYKDTTREMSQKK